MKRPDPMPHLAALVAALAEAGPPVAGFAALETALGAIIGHRLFTIMRHAGRAG